jgi:hypothetical protein
MDYEKKREHYRKQNLLAQTLHESAYDHNPGLGRLIKETGLKFEPHTRFMKADLEARCLLYRNIAEQIWNPKRLAEDAAS